MNKLSKRTTFIESFDTVRNSPTDPNRELHQMLSKLELLVGLLMGETMVVPENVSFDSYWFLDNATDILRQRNSVRKTLNPDRSLIDGNPVWNPFIPAIRGSISKQRTYLDLVTDNYKSRKYVLSSLPHLEQGKRDEIANHMTGGRFSQIRKLLSEESDGIHLDNIASINEYFERLSYKDIIEPQNNANFLADYFSQAKEKISKESPEFKTVFNLFDKEFAELDKQGETNFGYKNRSNVVLAANRLKQSDSIDSTFSDAVVELADDYYNRVVAESIGATVKRFSVRGSTDNPLIRLVDDISQEIAEEAKTKEGEMRLLKFGFDMTKPEELLETFEPLSKFSWKDFWSETMNNEDWIDSVTNLQKALANPNGSNVDECYHRHAENIAKMGLILKLDWKTKIVYIDDFSKFSAAKSELVKNTIPWAFLLICYFTGFMSTPLDALEKILMSFCLTLIGAEVKQRYDESAKFADEKKLESIKELEMLFKLKEMKSHLLTQGSIQTNDVLLLNENQNKITK